MLTTEWGNVRYPSCRDKGRMWAGRGPCAQYISNRKEGGTSRHRKTLSDILQTEEYRLEQNRKDHVAMYRVRYLEQTDKMSEQVCLRMVEEVYTRDLLLACVQQSPKRQQKARRLRHFTALSVLWFVLAMVLWSRLSQGRVWDKLTHWLQDRYPQDPQEPAGPSALPLSACDLGSGAGAVAL